VVRLQRIGIQVYLPAGEAGNPADSGSSSYSPLNPEVLSKGIDERHALKECASVKVLAENHRDLVQPGGGPHLGIPEVELVIAHPANSFQRDHTRQVQHGPNLEEILYSLVALAYAQRCGDLLGHRYEELG
jgi:hypothetical protein